MNAAIVQPGFGYARTNVQCPNANLTATGSLPKATTTGNFVLELFDSSQQGLHRVTFDGQFQSFSFAYQSYINHNLSWIEINGNPDVSNSNTHGDDPDTGTQNIRTNTVVPETGLALVLVMLVAGGDAGNITLQSSPWPLTLLHTFKLPAQLSCGSVHAEVPAALYGAIGNNLASGVVLGTIDTDQSNAALGPKTFWFTCQTTATILAGPPWPPGGGFCGEPSPRAALVLPAVPSPYPLLKNMRSYVPDRYETRPGLTLIATADPPIHSIRRLNDPAPGAPDAFTRIVGAATELYQGQTSLSLIDSGYSANPLSMVPWRPTQSPEALMYIADANKNVKVKVDGTVLNRGITPPLAAPGADVDVPLVNDPGLTNDSAAWTPGGTAGAVSNTNFYTATASGVVQPAVGGAFIVPSVWDLSIQVGASIEIGLSIGILIQSINKASFNTTIAAINYDSGTTGPCSIVLTQKVDPAVGFTRDCIVQINGTEYVRIEAVTRSPDGLYAARANTTGAFSAGQTIQAFPSFRVTNPNPVTVGTTIKMRGIAFSVTTGTATITDTTTLDFSSMGIVTRPASPDDYIHLGLFFLHPENIVEIRLLFDVDPSQNDFTRNYYYAALRQSDLTPADAGTMTTLSALTSGVQNAAVDTAARIARSLAPGGANYPAMPDKGFKTIPEYLRRVKGGPVPATQTGLSTPSAQAVRGQQQWTEIDFPIGSLTRVGSDQSTTLANIKAVRVQVICSGNISGIVVRGILLHGGYGPLVSTTGNALVYRYRARSRVTGAVSNWSPATRYGLLPNREAVVVTMTQHPDSQVDTLDVFRFGSDISSGFLYVGSTANTSTPSFRDTFSDNDIVAAQPAGFPTLSDDHYQPYPDVDVTHSGTCNVVGSTVTRASGDNFNQAWAPGSLVNIAGIYYTVYSSPTSTNRLEIVENAGVQNGVAFFLQEALIQGVSLPTLWGPWDNALWSVGSCNQPGYVFKTHGNDPDSASDSEQFEVTQPCEPLMNGAILGQQMFVFSSERIFAVVPSGTAVVSGGEIITGTQGSPYTFIEVSNVGLAERWSLCVGGGYIYYRGRDGIYRTSGSGSENITRGPWALIFPHEGNAVAPVQLGGRVINPPDLSQITRLSYEAGKVYFDFIDTSGQPNTLVFHEALGIWGLDAYNNFTEGAACHYSEEGAGITSLLIGTTKGNLYSVLGADDAGTAIAPEFRMPYTSLQRNYVTCRDAELAIISNDVITLGLDVSGTDFFVTLASTTGLYKKLYTPLPSVKARNPEWFVTSPQPFTLFALDSIIRLVPWAGDLVEERVFQPIDRFVAVKGRT